jgi:hypothetical protein
MKLERVFTALLFLTLCNASGVAQTASSSVGSSATGSAPTAHASPAGYSAQGTVPAQAAPVSYASVTELNGLLTQLEQTSKSAQADLAGLRIEKWKTDAGTKKQSLAGMDSVQRNLKGALPEIIGQLRAAPEDLPATFKLYRNLDALYDVMGGVVESAGAFGSKDEFQAISTDLSNFEASRRAFAGRIENLAASKEAEIVHLRTDLKTAQAAIPSEPPKKTVVDDNPPAKKPPVKKKPVAKPATPASTAAKPAATGQTTTPAPQPAPAKPPQ